MKCEICAKIDASNKDHPFIPPKKSANIFLYRCPKCNQLWIQFFKQFHAWQKATTEQRDTIALQILRKI